MAELYVSNIEPLEKFCLDKLYPFTTCTDCYYEFSVNDLNSILEICEKNLVFQTDLNPNEIILLDIPGQKDQLRLFIPSREFNKKNNFYGQRIITH